MVPSTAHVEPAIQPLHPFARSDSVASSVRSAAEGSARSLHRRSRTRTRSTGLAKRGKSQGPPVGSSKYDSDAGESFLDLDDAPPPPVPVLHDEPAEMSPTERHELKKSRRRSRTIGPDSRPTFEGLRPEMPQIARSWSALDMRDPLPEQSRGRQAKSDNGSVKGAKSRLRGISLPRQSFRQNSPSDCSSQPSPQTPYGFGDVAPVKVAGRFNRNNRDSMMTQNSGTSSSVYPASTSAGTRTESSVLYTDEQDEADVSYPEIVTPDHPDFDPDDVSNRLRLLLNNSYFLPPAHTKPSPLALSPNAQEPAKKSKQGNTGFLDFFRLGKSKSKPASPVPGSPPAVDGFGPILRTTSDTPTASGLLLRAQPPPMPSNAANPQPPPASRVVVLRERMDDLVVAAKEAEKELRKADTRKTKSQTTPRGFLDDVIDPTDAVDLPPPSADSIFAVQASAIYGLGPQDSVGAAVLAERLVPNSPGVWSISSEEDNWRKALLREAVSHSLSNTPDQSFSSSNGPQPPLSPPAQSEASFAVPTVSHAQKPKIGQRILEDLSIRTEYSDHSVPSSPSELQHLPTKSSMSSGERSPKGPEHPMLSAVDPPARAETPAHMPLPLAPPPRKQLVNPLYSLSQPDLQEAVKIHEPTPGSSSGSYHTVRKATSTPGLSGPEDSERAMVSLSPPPLPDHPGSKRGISPDSRELSGMPSFSSSTGRSRSQTESDSRYSSDSASFRTPMDTDVDHHGARPSMSTSVPSGRPSMSVSVSEYSMPSPTASAFRDGVFGSCRPPSSMSRRSFASQPEPPLPDNLVPLPSVVSRSIVDTPPPRLSSSVAPTVLPVPPRPRAVRPTYRPSTSTRDSRSSSGRPSLGSPAVSEMGTVQDFRGSFSQSSSASSPTGILAVRRGLGSPLALSIPSRFEPPVIHSAPAPASPTDFFDRIQSTIHNAMDDLETSDESESEDELSLDAGRNARSRFVRAPPGESPSTLRSQAPSLHSEPGHIESAHVETAQVFVEPRTQAISNRASSSSARPSIMRLGNHSTPQLSPTPYIVQHEPLPQFTYDPKKPIGNVVDFGRRSFTQSRSPFKSKGKGVTNALNAPLLPIGVSPSSPIVGRTSVSSTASAAAASSIRTWETAETGSSRRPATAPGGEAQQSKTSLNAGGRKVQRESILRFDGMLMQHLAAEKDRMKRITSDYASPVATHPPEPLPLGRPQP